MRAPAVLRLVALSTLAVALVLAAGLPLRAVGAGAAASASPIELVETRPVESTLGNPELRQAHDVWLEMIRGAKKSLDFEEFYCSTWPNEPLEDVLAAIGDAAKRGVRVRLILDANMHKTYPLPGDSLGKLANIQVRILDMKPHGGGVQHAKFFIVDDEQIYLGSQNMDWRSLKHIHELGVRIANPQVVAAFRPVYDLDWATAGGEPAPVVAPAQAPPIRIAMPDGDAVAVWPSYSPHGFIPDSTLWDEPAVVRLLDSARHDVMVQVLTYGIGDRNGRDSTLDQALRRAAGRGVRVRLIVSDWEKGASGMAALQALGGVPNVSIKLSTVPEWSGGYIPFARVEHCKYAAVDSSAVWVGTSNWERGYFWGTRNIAVTLESRRLTLQARRVFEASWNAPGAEALKLDATYAPKQRGDQGPAGVKKYGG
jgi:phosphatidylserine/phosphatidylglycerophosphate/cardiolipin synthase-like enzyme